MKKSLLLGILILIFPLSAYACNTFATQNPVFTFPNLGTFKTNLNNQILTPSINPNRYGIIINNCNNGGSSYFQIIGNLINTADVIRLSGKTYFRITKSSSPVSANPAQIYIAFSVGDNQDSASLVPVNDGNQMTLFTGVSATRGMRLSNVSLLIRGTNLTPGTFNISNLTFGRFSATGTEHFWGGDIITSFQDISIPNLAYTINSSTCSINSPNITLPSMRISDFPSNGAVAGVTDFTVTANCLDDAVNTRYSATITDNYTSASNQNGILLNGISQSSGGSNVNIRLTDTSNNPIPIGPLTLNNTFSFGSLNSSKTASKTFRASYFLNTIPATPGVVRSVSVLNLIYD